MTGITIERVIIDSIGTIGAALYAGSDKRLTKEQKTGFMVVGGILGLLLAEYGQSVVSAISNKQEANVPQYMPPKLTPPTRMMFN